MTDAPSHSLSGRPTADRPLLLTPGPLSTTDSVKQAMLKDWGSWDAPFRDMNADIRSRLEGIAGDGDRLTAVPLQGSGTFVVEAMLGTFVPRDGAVLMLTNGAYGDRAIKICERMGRDFQVYRTAEDAPPDPQEIDRLLTETAFSHLFVVHCETTSGVRNPVEDIAAVTGRHGVGLLIDAMSAFGALALDAAALGYTALAASANKCLEGVPGMGFVLADKQALEKAEGNAHSVSLDLHEQWAYMEKTRQWRFTPPTHVLAAFYTALQEHAAEGGTQARGARYAANCRHLVSGMRGLGFETFLSDEIQAPIIVAFHAPQDSRYDFATFYDRLAARGYVIYPGKLTQVETFRIGCIGAMGPTDVDGVVQAVADVLDEMGVQNRRPHAA